MKKQNLLLKMLLLCLCVVGSANVWATDIVSFSSGTWTGGTATYTTNGTLDSGKLKFASTDNTGTEGTKHVQVVLSSGTFQTGDAISITYYASKTSKTVTPGFFFGTITNDTFTSAASIQADETNAGSSSPATQTTLTVPAAANGSNVLRLTRYAGGTTLYITAISITRAGGGASAYTVTFDAGSNGACATESLTEASAGAGVLLPSVTPDTDYAFLGWFTNSDEKAGDAGDTYKPKSDITLYAHYNQIVEPEFSLTKSKIYTGGTSQIQVGSTGDLDDVTLVDLTSSNTSVATVDATGLVTAVGAGTTDITFTSNAVTGKYKAVGETVTLTLRVTVADPMSCSAYLSGISGSPTQTKCTLKFYGTEGTLSTVTGGTQVGETTYYQSKMNNNANYYEVTLTDGKFQAGDILKVYLYGNNTTGTYILGKTAQTTISQTITSGVVNEVTHTLTAAEIEDNGTVRIYRNSSNTYFSGVALSGNRDATPKITAQPEGTTYETKAEATPLSVTATPYYNEGVLTYQWYSNTTESTEGASAIPSATSSTYTPSTASAGTTYYYCVVTEPAVANSVTSDIVSIVVADMFGITTSVAVGQTSRGSVSPSGTTKVAEGGSLKITAIPEAAYKFQHWIIDNDSEHPVTTNPYTFSEVSTTHTAVAYFVARKIISYSMTAAQKGTRTDDFATEYANDEDKWTAPVNKYLFSDNQTLKEWQDAGSNKYTPGTEYTLTGDITLTPVFEDNAEDTFAKTLEASKSDFTVTWNFGSDYGKYSMQGFGSSRTGYAVQQATINNKNVDIALEIDATNGKLSSSNPSNAQINANTVLTVPVVNNSVVTVNAYSAFSTTTINDVTTYTKSNSDKTATYTYEGSTGTIEIVTGSDIKYIYSLSVTYPTTFSPAPSISAGTFSLADKAYPVTITGETGTTTIETSVDGGANWTPQSLTDLACTVNVTAGQTLLARATAGEKEPSAEVSYTNSFDGEKSYVAWVYESNYQNGPKNYKVDTDKIVAALKSEYNFVLVDFKGYGSLSADEKTALIDDLKEADLVAISEAVSGGAAGTIALEGLVGNVPVLNMKMYAYGSSRWEWGTANNESNATRYFTPVSKLYKVLNGVTFSGDNVNLFDGSVDQKHIQTVTSWTAAPSGNVDMAKVGDTNVAMHASTSQKFFAIGLSCDDFGNYNTNAITIIKNAAAMLIAGDDLDDEMATVSGTISASGWNTFSSSYPLDLSTISGGTAYYAREAADSKVTVSKTTATVPAGEGLMIKGTEGDTFTIDVAASGTEISGNLMVGLPSGGEAPVGTYVFGWPTATPASYGFYYVNSAAAKLGAGKAYLDAGESIGARLTVVFDEEETTGISAALNDKGQMTNDNVVYDLQGRKVAQPVKGMYIVNGRKVVIK